MASKEAVADRAGAPDPTRCALFIKAKRRTCGFPPAPGSTYCHAHLHLDPNAPPKRKRVPCPVDPKHTVYEDKLEEHVPRCPALVQRQAREAAPYFNAGINAGGEETVEAAEDRAEPSAFAGSEKAMPSRSPALSALSPDALKRILSLIDKAYEKEVGEIKLEPVAAEDVVLQPPVPSSLASPSGSGSEVSLGRSVKHPQQLEAIVEHAWRLGLLSKPATSAFVEFGAGKGTLSHSLKQMASKKLKFDAADQQSPSALPIHVLVDRSSFRHKTDKDHNDEGSGWHRIRCDIVDLDLNYVEVLKDRPDVVAVGKHCCGCATDFSLRGITGAERRGAAHSTQTHEGKRQKLDQAVKVHAFGVAIATCCHHACNWQSLCGKELFLRNGFERSDFKVLTAMSSWATCGLRPDMDADAPGGGALNMTHAEKERYGMKIKNLIDAARLNFLKEFGFEVTKLVRYVESSVTPENVLLLAMRKAV